MIKVLFFIPTLGHGGAERVLVNLVNNMDQTKFDITVQTMFDVGIYRDKLNKGIKYKGGLKWYFRGNTVLYQLFSPKQLYKMYIKEEYDVIISYLEGPSSRVVFGCQNKDIKKIAWIHTQLNERKVAYKSFRTKKEAEDCYSSYDLIACVSQGVKDSFYETFNVDCPVRVMYNTIEAKKIIEKSLVVVDDIKFSDDKINLVSVGKLIKVKGYDRLIEVVNKLIKEKYKIKLYLLGVGEEKGALEKKILEYKLEDSVIFCGFKDNPYKYVKNADIYVCSSYREGFSTAVTEALIVGTPVVSTNCSGAKELLGYNNEYGIVTNNDEESLYLGIKEMIKSKETMNKYKEKAKERGQKFSIDETVGAVEQMLEEVVKG